MMKDFLGKFEARITPQDRGALWNAHMDSKKLPEKEPEEKKNTKEKKIRLVTKNIKEPNLLKAPDIKTESDRERMKDVKKAVEEEFGAWDISKEKKNELVNIVYNLNKEMDDKNYTPPTLLAFAGGAISLGIKGIKFGTDAYKKWMRVKKAANIAGQLTFGNESALINYDKAIEGSMYGAVFSKKKDDSEIKLRQKDQAKSISFTGGPKPDPDDEKEGKKKRYKYTDYKKNDNVGLERFTERFEGNKFRDPKSGQYIQKDRAINSGSGAHTGEIKLFNKAKQRIGTLSKTGIWINK